MRYSFLLLGLSLLVFQANAAPVELEARALNTSLPNVKIFGTGGTIASKGTSGSQTAGYSVGLTAADLISAVPDLSGVANLDYVQVSNVGSNELNTTHLMVLYRNISESLQTDIDGAVVTHGTDTMEETAFFLDLTIKSEKPVVIVGAMRPSTAISADGPMNLYEAVSVAASDTAKGRGSMILLNDRIASGFWTTKMNAVSLDTFKADEQGYLGAFVNNEVMWYYPPVRPNGYQFFDLSSTSTLPEVIILYGYQGLNPELIRKAAELGAKGLVFAGLGAGSWTTGGNEVAKEIWDSYGIPIVYSHRTADGTVPVDDVSGFEGAIASGILNPQKSRILLQLCLNAGYSVDQIKTSFSTIYGG